jgi:S-adenosylmethionine decarboxylase
MTNVYLKDLEGIAVTGFEGPEKRLEVDFKRNPERPEGLRAIDKEQWQEMLNLVKCTIISHTKNDYFDSYVLSESSLFVYPFKMMIKTCGTTTLLKCIPKLMEMVESLDLTIEFVMFSRKNFLFPQKQIAPHSCWDAEVAYLNSIFDGNAYTFGPKNKDHWNLYVADYSEHTRAVGTETTLEILMHNLDRDVMSQFYKKEEVGDRDKFPGMADFLPGSDTDEFNFTPCGYSMNGLNNESYYTIHITPEPHCSYVSFETNTSLPCYRALVSHVLSTFKPGTATVILMTERSSTDPSPRNSLELDLPGFVVKHKSCNELEESCDVTLVSLMSEEFEARESFTPK